MQILVLRHGESEADILQVHEGRADFPLTQRGRRQAQATAAYLAGHYAIQRIYASTLRRAGETAQLLSAATGAAITWDEDLMEFNNGLLAGLSRQEAAARYPEPEDLPLHESRYGMESRLAFRYRAERVWSRLTAENDPDSVIAVVSHGGMIQELYRCFFRLPVDSAMRFATGDTGFHEWLLRGEQRCLVKANWLVVPEGAE